jgi:hypothetical protein
MTGEAGEFFFGSRGATYFNESLFSAAPLREDERSGEEGGKELN